MKYYSLILCCLFIFSCQKNQPVPGQTSFGEAFEINEETPFEPSSIAETASNVQLKAKVTEVCQKKGCWMKVVTPQAPDTFMVRFKDYGFFMPKDLAGKEVYINGTAQVEITPVDELRHYAEDAGKSPEEIAAITAPKKNVAIEASGVKISGHK